MSRSQVAGRTSHFDAGLFKSRREMIQIPSAFNLPADESNGFARFVRNHQSLRLIIHAKGNLLSTAIQHLHSQHTTRELFPVACRVRADAKI